MKKYFIGDSCLCWSIGDAIEPELSLQILAVYRRAKNEISEPGVLDYVPSYNALAIHFDPVLCDLNQLEEIIDDLFEEVFKKDINELRVAGKKITIPVIYDGDDLPLLSEKHQLSQREIIDIHKGGFYSVAMIGFKPHFPYLIGLDKRLETPRLKTPRLNVPAGAVAIGGSQTGIYPEDSPGGWNIIGMTNPSLLKEISPGDNIEFKEVEKL